MTEFKATRLSKLASEYNVGISTMIEFLRKNGFDANPNTKLEPELVSMIAKEYSTDMDVKKASERIDLPRVKKGEEPVEKEESFKKELLVVDNTAPKPAESRNIEVSKPSVSAQDVKPEPSNPSETVAPKETVPVKPVASNIVDEPVVQSGPKIVGKVDLNALNKPKHKETAEPIKTKDESPVEKPNEKAAVKPAEKPANDKPEFIKIETVKLEGPTIVGTMQIPDRRSESSDSKKKRKRIHKEKVDINEVRNNPSGGERHEKSDKPFDNNSGNSNNKNKKKKRPVHQEVNEEDVQKQIKDTLARLTQKGEKSKTSKHRRDKREAISQRIAEEEEQSRQGEKTLKVTEFVSVNELAVLMNVQVTEVISTCMNMGLFVSINQRLDADTMVMVADEFGYKVQFVTADIHEAIPEEQDNPENMVPRPPIVTVMGHVDHGKTKLLDYIRNTNVISGEAGGITQHIGAYGVTLPDGRQITFLDTPGHEAFTAMRARGAKLTDVAIIVVAADDGVKQQTVEAINHAAAAGVPIVFAINKIDKPEANPDRVKEELANMNYLVEDWGGKFQSQEISAKTGLNVDLLLEKVLLESELLELKADPKRKAIGTVIESSLDKGRGYVSTVLVSSGTLKQGDIVLAGNYTGSVKAMYNERNQKVTACGPSCPVLLLGLDGAPQAGDVFHVMDDFKEARAIANRRVQLQREQGIRTKPHMTLDEIGRRIAIGNFQELNLIVKADVDGSVEALSDSLIKLSTDEIVVNVIHKAVGEISESDILLAVASDAIIVGFQVRPSMSARKMAEKEQIDIRLYSIIYQAIDEIKAAMEGMLSPDIKEETVATLEVKDVFKISKVGTIAGCLVREGKIVRNSKVRLIRNGIVIYTGEVESLRREKDDVKEVTNGYECGVNLKNYNDIKAGDVIEAYQETEVKKKL